MSELSKKHCVPCRGGIPPLTEQEIAPLIKELNEWQINEGHLEKNFTFKNFKEALSFVNLVGDLSEQEGHHPDIFLMGRAGINAAFSGERDVPATMTVDEGIVSSIPKEMGVVAGTSQPTESVAVISGRSLGWGKVKLVLWTHKINGLTESDFILASKIDTLGF